MRNTLIDAGPLIALFDAHDLYHQTVLECIKNYRGKLISTWPVITEVTHILDFSLQTQLEFLEWVEMGALEVVEFRAFQLQHIRQIMEKYADLPADFADSTLLLLAEQRKVREIITLDKDFSVLRTREGDGLTNILAV